MNYVKMYSLFGVYFLNTTLEPNLPDIALNSANTRFVNTGLEYIGKSVKVVFFIVCIMAGISLLWNVILFPGIYFTAYDVKSLQDHNTSVFISTNLVILLYSILTLLSSLG